METIEETKEAVTVKFIAGQLLTGRGRPPIRNLKACEVYEGSFISSVKTRVSKTEKPLAYVVDK